MGEAKGKRRKFDREFKLSAVQMITEGGHRISEVARSLGITDTQIYNWKKKFRDEGDKAFPGKGHLGEMAALRRKLKDVEMERDILKKAVGIFSKPTENGLNL